MKVLEMIRTRSYCGKIATRVSWRRPISTAYRSLQDLKDQSSDIDDPDLPKSQKPNRRWERWTAAEDKLIVEEHEKGATVREIWKKLPDRSLQSIYWKISLYNMKDPSLWKTKAVDKQSLTYEDKAKLLRLRQSGAAWREIMPQFPNRSYNELAGMFQRLHSDRSYNASAGTLQRLHSDGIDLKRPKLSGKWFTAKDTDTLVAEVNKGTPMKEISLKLKRSEYTLKSKLSRLGIKRPRGWSLENNEIMLRMRKEGSTFEQIAQHLDRSPKYVRRRWQRAQWLQKSWSQGTPGVRPLKLSPPEVEEIRGLREATKGKKPMPWVDIAASRFPDLSYQRIRKAFLHEMQKEKQEEQENAGTSS